MAPYTLMISNRLAYLCDFAVAKLRVRLPLPLLAVSEHLVGDLAAGAFFARERVDQLVLVLDGPVVV